MEHYRIHEGASVYYLTYSVAAWLPVFVSEDACRIVTDSLNYCYDHKGLRTNAFVIMPSHVHAIQFHENMDPRLLGQCLADFRRFTGRRLCDHCEEHYPPSFAQVLQQTGRQDRERLFWQPSRHPEAICSEAFYRQKANYLHANPCRKGLVRQPEHWRFSSAAYWTAGGEEKPDVVLTSVGW